MADATGIPAGSCRPSVIRTTTCLRLPAASLAETESVTAVVASALPVPSAAGEVTESSGVDGAVVSSSVAARTTAPPLAGLVFPAASWSWR